MADVTIAVDPRLVTGKQVRALRRQGITPAHLYGHATDSLSLQAGTKEIVDLLRTAKRNAIVDLRINGESEPRPVVLRGIQRNPVTSELLHVDFLQISLTERLRADVPLVLVGEAPAVNMYNGVLLQSIEYLHVEALPMDVPEQIEVDVSGLAELDASLHVRDLNVPANVEVHTDTDQLVAKVEPPKIAAELEAEEAAAAAEAEEAAEGEAKPEEGKEGEAPAETEESKEEGG